jgi:hypothetical protein
MQYQHFQYFGKPKFGEPGFKYVSYGFIDPIFSIVNIAPIIENISETYMNMFQSEISERSEEVQNAIKAGKKLRFQSRGFELDQWNEDEKEKIKKFDKFHKTIMEKIISNTKYQDDNE